MKIFLLYLIIFTSFSLTAQVPSYVPLDSLVSWWSFSGNANDETGNGNNGTVNGATLTTDRFGNSNSAYDFDGLTNYIQVADAPNLDGMASLTISVWINCRDFGTGGGGSGLKPIISKWISANYSGSSYLLDFSQPALDFTVETPSSSNDYVPFNPHNLSLNEWYNIVGVYDINFLNLYVNGTKVSTSVSSGTGIPVTSTNLLFGDWYYQINPNYSTFDGKLDDIGIWNRSLDSCEILDLYNASLGNCITSINELNSRSVKLYPNPASNKLRVEISNYQDLMRLQIYNTNGSKVKDIQVKEEVLEISLAGLQSGVYHVLLFDGTRSWNQKLVVLNK